MCWAHYDNLSDISIKVIPDAKLVQHFDGWCLGDAVCFERKCQQKSCSLVWGGNSWSYLQVTQMEKHSRQLKRSSKVSEWLRKRTMNTDFYWTRNEDVEKERKVGIQLRCNCRKRWTWEQSQCIWCQIFPIPVSSCNCLIIPRFSAMLN